MSNHYNHLDITFTIDSVKFHVTSIMHGCCYHIIQSHSHGNGCYEIHYIPSGYGRAVIDGQLYHLSPGTLYVTGPHVEHSQISDKEHPLWEYCIYFYVPRSCELSTEQDSNIANTFCSHQFWFHKDTQNVESTLKQLFSELAHKPIGYQLQITLLLQQLIIQLVRNYEKNRISMKQYPPANLLESSTKIIEDHFLYQYQHSSLEELSTQLGLSRRQTQRLIKKLYGKTYIQKRSEARMSMAATFLTETDLSIGEISVKLGFATAEYFSCAFKSHFGISAQNYRRQHQLPPSS